MKKVFITGVSGLVGTHLANALAETDCHVCGISRHPENYTGKRATNIELIAADLMGDYSDGLRGADVVVHLASETSTDLPPAAYDRVNFDGTVRLFESAKTHGVKHFIFVSTANTIGYGDAATPGTEHTGIREPFTRMSYAQSKLKAENYLLANREGIKLTILNPTFIVGAHGGKPSSARIFLMSLGKRVVFYPPGGKNFVAVNDVVQAIRQAFHRGKTGERYLIAGENLSYRTFFKKLGQISGQRQRFVCIPAWALTLIGRVGDALRLAGVKTSLSSPNMRALCIHPHYSNKKSIDELGIAYSGSNDALASALRDMGYETPRK